MFFTQRVETVGGIKDFLTIGQEKKEKIGVVMTGVGVGTVAALTQIQTQAPEAIPVMVMPTPILGLSITQKIIDAFDPIVQLIQGISYPVGFIMITAGFLVMMTGNRQKGINMIKWAAVGYIGMQFAPAIMAILVEVGKAMAQ